MENINFEFSKPKYFVFLKFINIKRKSFLCGFLNGDKR